MHQQIVLDTLEMMESVKEILEPPLAEPEYVIKEQEQQMSSVLNINLVVLQMESNV
jgi:hypothetical protein